MFELINNMDIGLWSIPVIDSNHTLIKRVYVLNGMVKNDCAGHGKKLVLIKKSRIGIRYRFDKRR